MRSIDACARALTSAKQGDQEATISLLKEAKEHLDIEVQEARQRCEFFEAHDLVTIFGQVVDNCRCFLQGKHPAHQFPLAGRFHPGMNPMHVSSGSSSSLDVQWASSD